jgi:hypothetical protein
MKTPVLRRLFRTNLAMLFLLPATALTQPLPAAIISRLGIPSIILVSGVLFLLASPTCGADPLTEAQTLNSGGCTLTISTNSPAGGVELWLPSKSGRLAHFQATKPLTVEVLSVSGATNWLSAGYSSVVLVDTSLRCIGQIQAETGSLFKFSDTYRVGRQPDTFLIEREVSVEMADSHDVGFMTCFRLESSSPSPLCDQEVFIPGVWYLDNQHVPPGALGANPSDDAFLIREDRMALPLVMMRNKGSGTTILLAQCDPDGATCLADYQPGRLIDTRIHVGSLGLWSHQNPAVSFCYPAAEGERTYLRGSRSGRGTAANAGKQWLERFHPVRPGAKQFYRLMLGLRVESNFPAAMRQAWRTAYADAPPQIAHTDIPACYEASIKLISDWSQSYNGCPGIPFRLSLPEGKLMENGDINYQMGFVGQQLPLAYHLLRYGLLRHDESLTAKGEATVNFWATNSLTPEGLPRTWFDVYPRPHWRQYNTYMRVASDGMVGALMAYDVMQAAGRPKPEWLQFCRRFGDWLLRHQGPDGSWGREYAWDSHPVNQGRQNTTHPIPYLVDLSKVTGEKKYLDAATAAGNWCYTNVHLSFGYVGGTTDNPNVMDKEAGFLAIGAFLALHDATGQKRWLDAAAQAADFTETWVYSWNIPIPEEDAAATYPKGATTTGFSLIATGHSGADLFMAAAPFNYYRLYLETGDAHYRQMACQLLYNTKQAMDINDSLGYGHTGLCSEALSLSPPRGHGVNTRLPRLTWAMIEPITRLQDAYSFTDTPDVSGDRLAELQKKDFEFGQSRGLASQEDK